jgi:CheY-like chemotaxis protein
MPEFIFMLTKNDQTVPDALEVFEQVRDTGIKHVGFKDVGLPILDLKRLAARIREAGCTVHLEVVSLDRDAEIQSAKAALEIGVDYLLGGTRPEDVLPVIKDSNIRYCPFPGEIVGHPSLLRGGLEGITTSAARIAAMPGVHGLDLLAYRFDGDVPELVRRVLSSVSKPVIAAGSVDTLERIETLSSLGVWGFTVGSAIFDQRFGVGVREQVTRLLSVVQAHTRQVNSRENV